MTRRRWTDEQLIAAVPVSYSLAETLRHLGLKPGGGTYVDMRRHIRRLGLSTEHWSGQGWRRGSSVPVRTAAPLEEVLVRGRHVQTNGLRKRLLREGVLQPQCATCGITQWCDQPAPLQLDHVNGDRSDNRIENLRLLCPNCHAQTPMYCGKNIRRAGEEPDAPPTRRPDAPTLPIELP